jgi:hypothetical protein
MMRPILTILVCLFLGLTGCAAAQSDTATPDEEADDANGEATDGPQSDGGEEDMPTDPETTEEVIETSQPLGG